MPYVPTDDQQSRIDQGRKLKAQEAAIVRERNAIRDAVWGPPEPYEDEFYAAKFDDVNTVSPAWCFNDWIHRHG